MLHIYVSTLLRKFIFKMKIAILYICTGKYNLFFNGFYESAMLNLLPNVDKTFFVWSDDDNLGDNLSNVIVIHKECAGFPADSLFRFELFMQVEDELSKFDYIYFFNANAEIRQTIGIDILPDESGLAMGIWPGKREHQHPMFFPYERNRKSLAYVAPYGKNYTYYMGGINGGSANVYLNMIRTLCNNIRDDYNRGIIAKYHDESHINAYLRHHPCKKLGREYCLPEEWIQDGEFPKNVFRNKVLIDSYFNKGRKFDFFARLKKGCSIVFDAVRWYLFI